MSDPLDEFSTAVAEPETDNSSAASSVTLDDFSSPVSQAPIAEIDGIGTTFADPGDLQRYNAAKAVGATEDQALQVGDNGQGHPSLGYIDTPNVYGIAVPMEHLQQAFGNDQAAWRRARGEVTIGGKTMRLPFVDLGPGQKAQRGGVVMDMTNPTAIAFGSNGQARVNLKFIPEAGPDYLQDPQGWYDEQQKLDQANSPLSSFSTLVVPGSASRAQPAGQAQAGGKTDTASGDIPGGADIPLAQLSDSAYLALAPEVRARMRASAVDPNEIARLNRLDQNPVTPPRAQPVTNYQSDILTQPVAQPARQAAPRALPATGAPRAQVMATGGGAGYDQSAGAVGSPSSVAPPAQPSPLPDPVLDSFSTPVPRAQPAFEGPWSNPPPGVTSTARAVSPLWPTRAIPSQEMPTDVTLGEPGSPPYVAGEPMDVRTMQPKQPPQQNDLAKFVQNTWQSALESAAQLNKGAYQAEQNQPSGPNDPFDLQIQETQVNPDLSDAQKAQMIAALKDQQARAHAQLGPKIAQEQSNIAAAEAAKPDQGFQQSVGGHVSSFLGGAAPYLASGAAGPLGPIAAATQMTASAYGQTLDRAIADSKTTHPEWTDEQRFIAANQAASDSAKASGMAGLAIGFVNVPVIGPLLSRMLQKFGIGAAAMMAANVYAGVQENIALKKSVDPELDIYSGLMDMLKSGLFQGGAFALPHAIGEIGRGRVTTPEPQPAIQTPPEAPNAPQAQPGPFTGQPTRVPNVPIPPDLAARALGQARAEMPNVSPTEQMRRALEIAKQDPSFPKEPAPEARTEPVTPQAQPQPAPGPLAAEIQARKQNAIGALQSLGIKPKEAKGWVDAAKGDDLSSLITDALRKRDAARQIPPPAEAAPNALEQAISSRTAPEAAAPNIPQPETRPLASTIEARTGSTAEPAASAPGTPTVSEGERQLDAQNDAVYQAAKQAPQQPPVPSGKISGADYVPGSTEGMRPEDKKLYQAHVQNIKQAYSPETGAVPPAVQKGKFDYEAALRGQLSEQAQEASAQGQEPLLRVISQNGGLPTPRRLKAWTAHGENLTGEMGRVYDAWKALGADDKAWLKKQGTGYSDLFTNDAKPFDQMNSDLAQTPGAKFESAAEMLDQVEEALSKARERREHFAEFYAGLPIPKLTEEQKIGGTESFKAIGLQKGAVDYFNDYPVTQPLSRSINDRFTQAQENFSNAKVADLIRAAGLKGKLRDQVRTEFENYMRAEQNGQPVPPVRAETARLIKAMKFSLSGPGALGDIATRQGTFVLQSDGTVRLGRYNLPNYYPRMYSADFLDMIDHRDGSRAAEFDQLAKDLMAAQPNRFKSRQDVVDYFTHSRSDVSHQEFFSNLERAREVKLPSKYYDYTPESGLRYVNRTVDRLAQNKVFGQKLDPAVGKDSFDRTVADIEASKLNPVQKRWLIDAVRANQRIEYGEGFRTQFQSGMRPLRALATAGMIGNPASSLRYLITGQAQNLAMAGPTRYAQTIARLFWLPNLIKDFKDAKSEGILRAQLRNLIPDWTKEGSTFTQKLLQGSLHLGGHNLADSMNRVVGMQIARSLLRKFGDNFGKNTAAQQYLARIVRGRGITDLQALVNEHGNGPLSDKFMRGFVNDVHGTYTYAQSPSWMHDPSMSWMFQFQQWDVNAGRLGSNEFIMPLAHAIQARDPAAVGYHFMRNLGYSASMVSAGLATQAAVSMLTGKKPNDPTFAEIGKAILQSKYQQAFVWAAERLWGASVLSGFLGIVGNFSQMGTNIVSAASTQHFKDPTHPPAIGILTPTWALLQGWIGENMGKPITQWHGPSKYLLDQWAQGTISAYRVGKGMLTTAATDLGVKWDIAQEHDAYNKLAFLRSRVRMFDQANPLYGSKVAARGTRATAMAGRDPFDPTRDDIQAGLLTGNAPLVREVVKNYLNTFPYAQRADMLKRLQQSVRDSQPIKPGGSSSAQATGDFLMWTRANLPADEAAQITHLAQTYSRTADAAGFSVRVPQ